MGLPWVIPAGDTKKLLNFDRPDGDLRHPHERERPVLITRIPGPGFGQTLPELGQRLVSAKWPAVDPSTPLRNVLCDLRLGRDYFPMAGSAAREVYLI